MTSTKLPESIQTILDRHTEPEKIFADLLAAIGSVLQCDRCFLYVRNPQTEMGKVGFCWRRNSEIPDVHNADWETQPQWLTQKDPLYAAALRTEPSVYVEDVETASSDVVNREFEQQQFGHRALIHAHLCLDGQLWGILQPCIFGSQRVWSEFDRAVITELETELTPLVITYVKSCS